MATTVTNNTDIDPVLADSDSPMFAPIPAWERGKKRKSMFGARRPAEPRSFTTIDEPVVVTRADTADLRRPARATTTTVVEEPINEALMSRPMSPVRKSSGAAPLAIAAGVVILGGLGAAGWYAAHKPATSSMAQLTPGQAEDATTTIRGPAPMETAANTAAPAAPVTTTRQVTTTRTQGGVTTTHRTVSRSVNDSGVDASARLPDAPQPYSGSASAPVPSAPMTAVAPPAAPVTEPAPVTSGGTPDVSAAVLPPAPAAPAPTPPDASATPPTA